MHDKRGLAAFPVERRHRQPGRMRRNGMAVVPAEQVQAHVKARRRSGGGHDPPVVQATVRRYVQQHALPVEFPGLPPVKYDGITELWFDDVEAIGRLFSDAEYLRVIRPDEASFLDLEGCDFIVSDEHAVLPPAAS